MSPPARVPPKYGSVRESRHREAGRTMNVQALKKGYGKQLISALKSHPSGASPIRPLLPCR